MRLFQNLGRGTVQTGKGLFQLFALSLQSPRLGG